MAKISTYPFDTRISGGDTLIGTDSVNFRQTKQFSLSSIQDFIISTGDVITGSGTPDTVPIFTGAYTIGNSIITQAATGQGVTIGGALNVTAQASFADAVLFTGEAEFASTIADGTGGTGAAGQVLSSTGAGGVQWTNNSSGTGTTDYVVKFTDGPNGTIGDSTIIDVAGETQFTQDVLFNDFFQGDSGAAIDGQLDMISGGPILLQDPQGPPNGKNVTFSYDPAVSYEFKIQREDRGSFILDQFGNSIIKAEQVGAGIASSYFFGTGGTFRSGSAWELRSGGNGFYNNTFIFRDALRVGGTSLNASLATIDVGNNADTRPAAVFRNGVVISNNPGGIQVDNTSMVIGAGNNDVVSGSDNCLAVGNGNAITNNSDHSVALGLGNTIRNNASASLVVGQGNTLDGTGLGGTTARSYILGLNNNLTGSFASFIAGGANNVTTGQNAMILGFNNTANGIDNVYAIGETNTLNDANANGVFMIGNGITGQDGNMVLGFRNDTTGYPTPDYANGLGNTKLVLSVGTVNNTNAIVITEGGVTRGGGVTQIPRILMPSILSFDYADDAAAALAGIPVGGIYHNAGALRIRRT